MTDSIRQTPPSVLVVDDSPTNRDVVSRVLSGSGYVVTTAADGPTALARLSEERFDLYILDLMMPLMNGREVALAIRLGHPAAKILYVTAFSARLFRETAVLPTTRRSSRSHFPWASCARPSGCCCSGISADSK